MKRVQWINEAWAYNLYYGYPQDNKPTRGQLSGFRNKITGDADIAINWTKNHARHVLYCKQDIEAYLTEQSTLIAS